MVMHDRGCIDDDDDDDDDDFFLVYCTHLICYLFAQDCFVAYSRNLFCLNKNKNIIVLLDSAFLFICVTISFMQH